MLKAASMFIRHSRYPVFCVKPATEGSGTRPELKMANKIVKYLGETYGKTSLWGNLKAGGLKGLLDGNVGEQIFTHGPKGEFKGKDSMGNKYYENTSAPYGRHRWVIYGNMDFQTGQDPTEIPPEWHSWINHISNVVPTEENTSRPVYAISQYGKKNGIDNDYLPKGAWKNPEKRNWTRYQIWVPPGQ